jgi:serine/threonine protein kinase
MALQDVAELYSSAPYRAPELWDVASDANVDERVDVWALGCLLYALLYREGPFDWQIDQNSIALAVMSGKIRWPNNPNTHYPLPLHHLILFMLQVGTMPFDIPFPFPINGTPFLLSFDNFAFVCPILLSFYYFCFRLTLFAFV